VEAVSSARSGPALDVGSRRIPELDGLRGVAILLVLLMHYLVEPGQFVDRSAAAYVTAALRLSWTGVDLFFVLSGFLITGILIDHRGSPNYFPTFYRRRFYRIVPLYAAVCAVFLFGLAFFLWRHPASLQWLYANAVPWPYLATFTQNFWLPMPNATSPFLGVTWSLAVEEHFYLTLPFLIRVMKPSRLTVILCGTVLAAPLLRLAAMSAFPQFPMIPYMYTPCRADALALGALGALLVRNRAAWHWVTRHAAVLYGAFACFAVVLVLLTRARVSNRGAVIGFLGYSCIAMFYFTILMIVLTHENVARIFRIRLLTWLGTVAYAAYLFHLPIEYACFGVLRNSPPRIASRPDAFCAILALCLTLVAAGLSWTFIEKRLVAAGHRYRY
jgi:peptidoglycan/LPS O-acetylase OafA/YrhL